MAFGVGRSPVDGFQVGLQSLFRGRRFEQGVAQVVDEVGAWIRMSARISPSP